MMGSRREGRTNNLGAVDGGREIGWCRGPDRTSHWVSLETNDLKSWNTWDADGSSNLTGLAEEEMDATGPDRAGQPTRSPGVSEGSATSSVLPNDRREYDPALEGPGVSSSENRNALAA